MTGWIPGSESFRSGSCIFRAFASLEHLSYQLIWKYEAVRNEFRKCAREHLNNPEIGHWLYREGLGAEEFSRQLREVVYPVYLSAKTCGFSSWECLVESRAFPEDAETLFKVAERK